MEEKEMPDEAAMIEAMAKAICADDGFDPNAEDELAPLTANGTHQPHWVRYEDNAKAALAALRPYFAAIRRKALDDAALAIHMMPGDSRRAAKLAIRGLIDRESS